MSLVLVLFVYSCYSDDTEVLESIHTAHRSSDLTSLVKSATLHKADFDDVIDGTSCFSIVFPYEISLNGNLETINTKDDILKLDETDDIELQFPVSVVYFDYSISEAYSLSELQTLKADCEEVFTIEPNRCVKFTYPVTVKDYNDYNNNFHTHHFDSDKEFFLYLEHLHDSDMFEIEYPIQLIDSSSEVLDVNSNSELMNILGASNSCD